MGPNYGIFLILAWLIGITLFALSFWGVIWFTRSKKYIRAVICWIILISPVIYFFLDQYRIHLYKRLEKPMRQSLIANHNSIPSFLKKNGEQFSGFENVTTYVRPEDLKSSGRPPILVIRFEIFNFFQLNCQKSIDSNQFIFGSVPTEILVDKSNQKINVYVKNNNQHQSMKLFMEDEFGCLDISTENLSDRVTKNDLLKILNDMIRVQ